MPIFLLYDLLRSIIPSDSLDKFNSDFEQSIPNEVSPLILETSNFMPFFGIIEPGGAYTVSNPSLALGAPHTTLTFFAAPTSTSHNFNLSAFGCLFALIIFATIKLARSFLIGSTFSTSKPILFNFSIICSSFFFVFK